MAHEHAKFETLKPFCFLFRTGVSKTFIKTYIIESGCYKTEKHTVYGRVRASFSLEMLQAGAVKGLNGSA